MRSLHARHRGMGLIDVVVGAALFLTVFAGLFGILQASLKVASLARARAAATGIASSQMEYLRSLAYASVGTVGGVPSGIVPQTATTTQAGTLYTVRTYIAYVDDPRDGTAGADANHITTDYKVAKIAVSYVLDGATREVDLVSNIAPEGIETTTGGGTLEAHVVDAYGAALPGATVRIENSATSPTIDVSTFSDTDGIVYLGGAPTSTAYNVTVSKSGYSTAETYARDGTNANPNPGYLTVAASQTTTGTFAIDRLATLIIHTFTPIQPFVFTDSFTDASHVAVVSGAAVSGGALVLSGAPGSYPASGTAQSSAVSPQYLASWVSASSTASLPAGTSARISVADENGALLSDTLVPGNSSGFTGTVDLSGVSTSTYPSLTLVATLASSDPNATPSLADWSLGYTAGPIPAPDIPFEVIGGKTIGSTSGGASLYKTDVATTTDATGARTLSLEWDSYSFSVTGHSIVSVSTSTPFELLPNTSVSADAIISP